MKSITIKTDSKSFKILWWSNSPFAPCFDVETEVLTRGGWIPFKDLKMVDEVATYNEDKNLIEYHRPYAVINEPYEGLMYHHESKHVSIVCTPNHRMYVRTDDKLPFRLKEARDVFGHEVEHFCGGMDWNGNSPREFGFQKTETKNNSVKHIGSVDSKKFMEFLGWYIAEGSYSRGTKGEYIIGLALNKTEADKVHRICCDAFPTLTWFKVEEAHKVNLRTYSKELYGDLSRLGRSHEKHIPDDIKSLDKTHLTLLLDSLIAGDGYIRNGGTKLTTSSKRLRDDVMDIGLKLGYAVKYTLQGSAGATRKIEGRTIHQNYDSWVVSLNSKSLTPRPHRDTSTEEWVPNPDGRIYCAVVKNHIMIVRRHGKVYLSGNTGYGVGTKGVVYPLNKFYDVRCLSVYGLEGSALGVNNLIIYPRLFDQFGIDAAELIVKNWKPDVMVTLFDLWIGDSPLLEGQRDWFTKIHPKHIAYFPVDHEPAPDPVVNQARRAYRAVTMSQFGQRMMDNAGVKNTMIPHGVDTNIFKPPEDKEKNRKWIFEHSLPLFVDKEQPWPEGCFVLGANAMNKDQIKRKGWDKEFDAIRIFLEDNPDARKDFRVHLHTWPQYPGGYPLDHLVDKMGFSEITRKTHTYHMYQGLNTESLAVLYGGFDVLMNACHSKDTRAWTDEGFKTVNELNIGDFVWTLNESEELELCPIEDIYINSYDGDMISLENKQFSLLVTPNHRVYYKSLKLRNRLQIREANSLYNKNVRVYLPTVGRWMGLDNNQIDISKYNQDNYHNRSINLPDKVDVDLLFSIMGWYISEGNLYKNSSQVNSTKIQISNKQESNQREVFELFKKIGLNPYKESSHECIDKNSVFSKPLSEILKECGQGSHNKRIPKWALQYSPCHLIHLFNSLMKGDGSNKGHNVTYYTVSNQLKDDIVELCMKLSYSVKPIYRTSPKRLIDKTREIKETKSWAISIRSKHNSGTLKTLEHVKKIKYEGVVWCLKTKNGNFFTERNNLLVMSGNSRGEGFGIPIIEAAACSVPTIGTRFTSMIELIEGHGWLVDSMGPDLTMLLSYMATPNEYQIAEAIKDAYNNPDKVKKFGEASREFSLGYDWEKFVVPLWVQLFEEIREEMRPKTLDERRMI